MATLGRTKYDNSWLILMWYCTTLKKDNYRS